MYNGYQVFFCCCLFCLLSRKLNEKWVVRLFARIRQSLEIAPLRNSMLVRNVQAIFQETKATTDVERVDFERYVRQSEMVHHLFFCLSVHDRSKSAGNCPHAGFYPLPSIITARKVGADEKDWMSEKVLENRNKNRVRPHKSGESAKQIASSDDDDAAAAWGRVSRKRLNDYFSYFIIVDSFWSIDSCLL